MNKLLKPLYLILIYFFLYLPIGVLILYSFNNADFSSAWHGGTLKWYRLLLQDETLLLITQHSLWLAVLAATLATILGGLGATALFRYQFFGKKIVYLLIFVLTIVPEIVLGIALLVLYAMLKLPLGFWTLLLAHETFCLPYVIITTYSRLKDLDRNIIESAQDLGASDYIIFIKIILPLIFPALLAGWLLSFTLSMDDVIISFFVSGGNFQILPLYIYSLVRVGVTPEINALCTLIFILTAILAVTSHLITRKKK